MVIMNILVQIQVNVNINVIYLLFYLYIIIYILYSSFFGISDTLSDNIYYSYVSKCNKLNYFVGFFIEFRDVNIF